MNQPIKIETIEQYNHLVEHYRRNGSNTNDYLQKEVADLIIHHSLYALCGEDNAVLLVQKAGFYRLYYYINDFEELVELPKDEYVTEILFRGDNVPEMEVKWLEKVGFKKNLIRDQYAGRYCDFIKPSKQNSVLIQEASTLEEVKWACELFNSSFDKWSGDYISSTQYPVLFENGDILIAKDLHGNPLGATQRELKKGYIKWAHLAVIISARGMGVGTSLMDAFIEHNRVDEETRFMMWAQRQNTTAVKIYLRKGFKPLNKSTLSMIKL